MPQEEAPLTPIDPAAFDQLVGAAVRALAADPRGLMVIDGRSGAGKTTVARRIAEAAGARLVSLDEFYPGWSGLAYATGEAARIAADHAAGRAGSYHRWDWERGSWIPHAVAVDPRVPLVIEGCGALSPESAQNATITAWIDGDAELRKKLALTRDGDYFAPYWDMWAEQEREHLARNDPQALANLIAQLSTA